jgi:hypothetical protein
MKPTMLALATTTLAVLSSACGDSEAAPFNAAITPERLYEDLHTLAHDSMGGRLTGSPDIARASDWIRDRFASLGLEPAGDGGYDQHFDLSWFSLGSPNRLTVSGAGGSRSPGQGWTPYNFSGTGSAGGGVVFVGFGIVEPRLEYDDYLGEPVEGRIVLVLEREPGASDPASPFDGVVTAEASRAWRKALHAQERGAAGILFVQDVHNRTDLDDWGRAHEGAWPREPRRIERYLLGDWVERIDIPAARISADLAESLVGGTGRTLAELAAASETDAGLGAIALPGARVSMTVTVERHQTPGRNILAMMPGSDPVLQDEVIIVGAHHDHNGTDGETVLNGADDDGSGTVGVMAVAEAYARAAEAGQRPRRSVLFAVWDAEERGLLGAWYYTLRPLFPLPSTAAVLNLDMIGRHEEVPGDGGGRFRGLEPQTAESNANAVNILGYGYTPELAAAVDSANALTALALRFRYDNNESNLLRRSDHWPFLQNDVPAVWFHTGLHPDYHTPDDDPARIEYEKMTRIVRLVHQASWNLANEDRRPAFQGMGSRPRS